MPIKEDSVTVQDFSPDTARLAGYFEALPEPAMRQSAAIRVLSDYSCEETVAILLDLVKKQRGTTGYVLMLEALMDVLAGDLIPYERLSDIYITAKEAGHTHLTQLLLQSRKSARQAEKEGSLDLGLRDQPLGMRKYMARHADSHLIDRLLLDPEPSVIYNLIRSPRITEAQVLRIATRRFSTPEVFKVILECYRWQRNYRVRLAMIYNPTVPYALSCKLLPTLLDQDLKDISRELTLSGEIRQLAEDLLNQRQHRETNFEITE